MGVGEEMTVTGNDVSRIVVHALRSGLFLFLFLKTCGCELSCSFSVEGKKCDKRKG